MNIIGWLLNIDRLRSLCLLFAVVVMDGWLGKVGVCHDLLHVAVQNEHPFKLIARMSPM